MSEPEGRTQGQDDPEDAAEGGQHHRLGQELEQHLVLKGPDGQPDADLCSDVACSRESRATEDEICCWQI